MRDDVLPPAVTGSVRTSFLAGGIALGILSTGLNFFLLVYYDQVLGLKPALAGLALALALLVDAVSDPLVGMWSDRLRSRFGRRHPFMLASLLPLGIAYAAIWFPPFSAAQQGPLFLYLLGTSLLLRLSLTLFDVPGNALIAELTRDYDERTRLSAYKVSSSWMSSNVMGMLMYAIWLSDSDGGILDQTGYQQGGLFFALLISLLAAASVLLLRRTIPYLAAVSSAPPPPPLGLQGALRAIARTYAQGPVACLLAGAVFLAAAMGLTQALWIYLMSFYWGLGSAQVNAIQLAYLAAAVTALLGLPRLAAQRDKRRLALTVSALFWVIDVMPYVLRALGWWPGPQSALLLPALIGYAFVDGVLFNMMAALMMSMLTDAVETNLLRTGRREEGVVLAGQTLVTKSSTALGTLLGAGLLTFVEFPRGVAPGAVALPVLERLGLAYIAIMLSVGALSLAFLQRYSITRRSHADMLVKLAEREAGR